MIRACSIVVEYDDRLTDADTLQALVAGVEGVLATGVDYDPLAPERF